MRNAVRRDRSAPTGNESNKGIYPNSNDGRMEENLPNRQTYALLLAVDSIVVARARVPGRMIRDCVPGEEENDMYSSKDGFERRGENELMVER